MCQSMKVRANENKGKGQLGLGAGSHGVVGRGVWHCCGVDADHAGCIDSRKSTFGGIQFLGDKLVSWMSKKQNCTAMSSA
nr:Gag-Pol polyprotein [Tanacetum cinerariifolium]